MLGGLWLQGHRGHRIRQVEASCHHTGGAMAEVRVHVHPEVRSEDHGRCRWVVRHRRSVRRRGSHLKQDNREERERVRYRCVGAKVVA